MDGHNPESICYLVEHNNVGRAGALPIPYDICSSGMCNEGTGTRNTREPTHILLLCAELELTNPSQIDI